MSIFELAADEASAYESDGFVIRENVFSSAEIARLGEAAERAVALAARLGRQGKTYTLDGNRFVDADHLTIQYEHGPASETIRVIEPVHELDAELDALIDDPRIVEPMCGLVECEQVSLWTGKLNLKRPREGSGFRWHQDSPYWIHDSSHVDRLPNVLITLDDATEANGCMRIIRGSHTNGCLPGIGDGSQLEGFFTDPACFDETQQVPLVVAAGSLVFFHPHSVHGSQPNASDVARRALILTYQPAGFPMLKSGELRNAVTPNGGVS
ncbi:MAG: phytanoyl-CoA dioxygenase family protein [Pseudomonadales bacterium]